MKRSARAAITAAGVLSAVLFCGCCSDAKSAACAVPGDGGDLAEAFCRNRAEMFIVPLADSVKKEFGKKEFDDSRQKLCKQLGEPVAKEYAGKLKHPFLDIDLWKITFGRVDSTGKNIRQDVLFQVVSAQENGREKVISFGFL